MGRPRSSSESVVFSQPSAPLNVASEARPRSVSICEEKPLDFHQGTTLGGRPRSDSICSETGRRKRKPAAPIRSVVSRVVSHNGSECGSINQEGECKQVEGERPRKCSLVERAEKLHLKSEPADEDAVVNIMDDDDDDDDDDETETASLDDIREHKRVRASADVSTVQTSVGNASEPATSPAACYKDPDTHDIDMSGVSILAALAGSKSANPSPESKPSGKVNPAKDQSSKKVTTVGKSKNSQAGRRQNKVNVKILGKPATAKSQERKATSVPADSTKKVSPTASSSKKTGSTFPVSQDDGKGKEFRCWWQGCSHTFGHKSHLTRHVRTVHEGRKDHICTYEGCRKSFRDKRDYIKHVWIVHEGRKDFQCEHEDCRRTFGDKRDYARHVRTAHPNSNINVNAAPAIGGKLSDSNRTPLPSPNTTPRQSPVPSQSSKFTSNSFAGSLPEQTHSCPDCPNCPGFVPPTKYLPMRYPCGCLVSHPDPNCSGMPTGPVSLPSKGGLLIPPPTFNGSMMPPMYSSGMRNHYPLPPVHSMDLSGSRAPPMSVKMAPINNTARPAWEAPLTPSPSAPVSTSASPEPSVSEAATLNDPQEKPSAQETLTKASASPVISLNESRPVVTV